MNGKDSKNAVILRVVAVSVMCGLLLALHGEPLSAKGRTWFIQLPTEAEDDGELGIGFSLFTAEGERDCYVRIVVDVKKGETAAEIRTKIVDQINEKKQLAAKINEETGLIQVEVKDDYKEGEYVSIKHVDWTNTIRGFYLKAWDP
jgi:hypothetical protein